MNKIIVSALLLSGMAANAQQQQVGINTATPKATLHVEAGASQNKGVIIPRITAAEMKTMTAGLGADHHSMMTYLKGQMPTADRTGKLVEVNDEGYYFYNHTAAKWEKVTTGENVFRIVKHPSKVGYNHITKDAGVGGNGTSAGASEYNIAIGQDALYSNTTGSSNVAMGSDALKANTSGRYNIAIGVSALKVNTLGENNIGLGVGIAHSNVSGSNNVALGVGALWNNVSGKENINMGYYSGHWVKGNGNIHIGNHTNSADTPTELDNVIAIGSFTSDGSHPLTPATGQDNVILLGNTSPNAPKVGIGTYKPSAKLEVNTGSTAGAVKIVDGTQGAGKVLTSDANGLATWKDQRLVMIQGVKGSGVTIPINTTGNKFVYTNSKITLPPGKYLVTVQCLMTVGTTDYSNGHIWLRTTFSDSPNPATFSHSPDVSATNSGTLISGLLPQGSRFSMLSGSVIINNTGTSPKTYYYIAGSLSVTPGTTRPLKNFAGDSEWSIIAVPMQ